MTATPSTSGSSTEADPPTTDDGDDDGGDLSDPGRRTVAGAGAVALVASIVALVCAALLPILPVVVNQPVVSWPADASSPRPTALQLTTQRPLDLDVRADCAAALSAGASADGVLLATMPPASPEASASALLASVRGDQLTVLSRGLPLYVGALPPGPCEIAVHGDLGGTTVRIDGRVMGGAGPGSLPDVDALTTSVPPGAPGVAAGLSVRMTLDDQFATSPTPLKGVAIGLLALAVVVVIGALVVRDRATRTITSASAREGPRLRLVDGIVPAVLVVWTFIAPMTDDDGYYSAMAANVPFSGYVANYYQLYNQGFTPFTWIYYVLSVWQTEIGNSPFLLRIPALLLALTTWVLLRAFAARALPAGSGRGRVIALHAALAVGFLAWWLPYDAGVRAEAVVATSVVASMLALSVGLERDRWSLLAVAVGIASFGATAAPTGFVALAPLLACLPAVWRLLRIGTTRGWAFARLVAVCGTGALVGLLAFADGSLRDFLRAQQIFLGMQAQETWYSEVVRWTYLLTDATSMGNFAKRTPVLLGLLALVVFGVLAAFLRGRGRSVPPRTALAATTLLLGFALLWLTPSKWTHHFGTLAGVGGLVLGLTIAGGPVLLRSALDAAPGRRPVPTSVVIGLGILLAAVAALGGHGANGWPYSWLLGLPDAGAPPTVAFVALDQPFWWLVGGLAAAGLVGLVVRRRAPAWAPLTGVVALSATALAALLVTILFLVGGFALATARTIDSWSPWADAVRDPLGRECGAAAQMQVLDPDGAAPLAPAGIGPTAAAGSGFGPGGWFPSSPPPADQERRAGRRGAVDLPVWGSFVAPPSGPGTEFGSDGAVGRFTTPWYTVPDRPDGAMTTSVSGATGDGASLRVEYARVERGQAIPVGGSELGLDPDGAGVDSPVWRGILLEEGNGPPPGATVMRLVAEDTSASPGGWMAFTAPSVQPWTSLSDYALPGEASAVSWQYAFLFPCQRKPVQQNGINEPSTLGVVWGDQELAYRFDGIWQIRRGGMFAQSLRDSTVMGLVTRLRDHPDAEAGTVYRLTSLLDGDEYGAYRLDRTTATVPGWSPAPNTTVSEPVEDD